jgi:hypothetical protein
MDTNKENKLSEKNKLKRKPEERDQKPISKISGSQPHLSRKIAERKPLK